MSRAVHGRSSMHARTVGQTLVITIKIQRHVASVSLERGEKGGLRGGLRMRFGSTTERDRFTLVTGKIWRPLDTEAKTFRDFT